MLDPQEKAKFDGLVTELREADPEFCRRMDRMGVPRPRLYTTLAFLLWSFAPLCIVLGGWTGTIFAAIFVAYGLRLYIRRNGRPSRSIVFPGRRTNPAS
ncbi:DUF3040 domain-containing protein [Actinoplanes solisilvae]|uniref:DUF3040 domain-containing protein n=1 Tax=Actinoplanes solisilvae TaxID=2486853 RepID=UPI000FDA2B19|nr:DUF3040 domain-containing protein [Actinoplanes solisilvae]